MNSYNNLRLRANISKGREDRLGPPKSMGRGPARSSLPKFLSVIAIAAAIALPQYGHDIAPGPPQTQPILLTNADIHTVSGESVLGGSLLFENGLITKIASRIDATSEYASNRSTRKAGLSRTYLGQLHDWISRNQCRASD